MRRLALAAGLSLLAAVLAGCAEPSRAAAPPPGAPGLTAFASDEDLRQFLKKRLELTREKQKSEVSEVVVTAQAVGAPPALASADAAAAPEPGITNTQEAGVDEGGIVKARGDLLVILRRGRLFTVSLAGGGMRPVDSIDAYPPGVDARGDWYDEMLVSGDRVVVIGYSYARGGTEIDRFRLSPDGRLSFEDAYHLKSNDYYSSRNYASRLIGSKLILYSPLDLGWQGDPLDALPGIRRWNGEAKGAFRRLITARQVYVPGELRGSDSPIEALHTVTSCDLAAPVLDCSATAVLGPGSRNFYVSGEAVYLWLDAAWRQGRRAQAIVTRLPLDGGRPSAVGARGAPVDQFAFREDPRDKVLNVLVRSEGGGDAMWRPEFSEGAVSLVRLPFSAFGDGSQDAAPSRYRALPHPGRGWDFRNRFVGDYVIYGLASAWNPRGIRRAEGSVTAVPVRGGAARTLALPHGVDRIEALGRDALVVGQGGEDLIFTALRLEPQGARLGEAYVSPRASQSESRSHGFFFKPDVDGITGVLGLPVARGGGDGDDGSAAVTFLRRSPGLLAPLGELRARPARNTDDGCRASCVDWYGNARPIFRGDRTFALMGYELVEGQVSRLSIREVDRINFAPRREQAAR